MQEKINKHARYGDIQPDGQRPPGDAPVTIPLAPACVVNGFHHERHDNHGQNQMGEQDKEIRRFYPLRVGKACGAVIVLVYQVADQEDCGGRNCCDHACSMSPPVAPPDLYPASHDEYCADRV